MQNVLSPKSFIISMLLILILGIGGIFAGYYFLNGKLPDLNPQEDKIQTILNNNPVTKKPVSVNLGISSPDDNSLVFSPNLLIQGKVTPQSFVLVSLADRDQPVNVGYDGRFSFTASLTTGVNIFTISAFDRFGNSQTEVRTIYYSTDKLN